MQVPHHSDHHDPPRLIRLARAVAVCGVTLAVAPAAGAAAAKYVALPSPFAQLSASPPLLGGAAASAEGVRHRITATTSVRVSIDRTGRPFAVQATQRLDVRVQGDYFFTIGAPAITATAAAGSESAPGLRSGSIVWAGFNPGRRILAAMLALEPRLARGALPLRIEVGAGRVTLENETAVDVNGFAADIEAAPLALYAGQLERDITAGRTPTSGGALVTSTPRTAAFHVVAVLHVSGTIGGAHVDRLLGAAPLKVAGRGPIRLTVEPVPPLALLHSQPGGTGRTLLARVTRALLGLARARQYDTYLGNPDPAGRNETTYVYRSAARPAPVAAPADAAPSGRGSLQTILVTVGLLGALALGVVAWARS